MTSHMKLNKNCNIMRILLVKKQKKKIMQGPLFVLRSNVVCTKSELLPKVLG